MTLVTFLFRHPPCVWPPLPRSRRFVENGRLGNEKTPNIEKSGYFFLIYQLVDSIIYFIANKKREINGIFSFFRAVAFIFYKMGLDIESSVVESMGTYLPEEARQNLCLTLIVLIQTVIDQRQVVDQSRNQTLVVSDMMVET